MRDPRGFAIKFYTEDGNWDLVGNNLKVFFIRDAMKFPDMVHAFKPDPVSGRYEARRVFDFVQFHPEAIHMITWVQSPWGIPANYRQMEGSGVNTYKLVNADGTARLVQVPLRAQAGRAQPDRGRGGRDPGQELQPRHATTSTTPSSAATTRVGVAACR